MVKKIKRTVEMKFWELMKHVAENDIKDARFYGKSSYIDIEQGSLMVHGRHWFNPELKFNVEIEEDVTEETVLEHLVINEFTNYGKICTKDFYDNSIENVRIWYQNLNEYSKILSIYHCDENGFLTLIWEKEKGLVE